MPKRMDDADLPPVVMPSCAIRTTLSGQTALVTGRQLRHRQGRGAGARQGRRRCRGQLRSEPEQAEEVVAAIRHEGGNAYPHQADVSQEDQVQAMFATMIADFGTIDVWSTTPACSRTRASRTMTLQQ